MLQSKHGIAMVVALSLLFLAVPRLPVAWEPDADSIFAGAWLIFALLVIAANWRMVLQVDKEQVRRAEQFRRMRWLRAQREARQFRVSGQKRRQFH